MQNDIMVKFNEDNPQKREIKDGVRIKWI
jgi:hypothetical protein